MKIILLLFSVCLASQSFADEAIVSYGLGVGNSGLSSIAETKVAGGGYRYELTPGLYLQGLAGFWGDGSRNPARKSSAFGSLGPGLKVDLRTLELHSGYGLAYISTPDAYLGGRLPQFQGEAGITLRDKNNNGFGLTFRHLSSGGLVMPNRGRDFLMLELSKRW